MIELFFRPSFRLLCNIEGSCALAKRHVSSAYILVVEEDVAQIASDFIGPKALFRDIERRDSDESFEPFR